MKKYSYFFTTILIAAVFTSLLSCKQKDTIPKLLERKTAVSADADRELIKKTYTNATTALGRNPDDLQQYINLASAFIAEGRITGNSSYYNNAALQMLDLVINSHTANADITFQAYTLQSSVLLNYHQFKDALQAAEKGVSINSYSSGIYGALVDANVELGNYAKAVEYCDKMISLRPDLRSYSRASYLRQIHGQNRGAIEAMTMAVEAGVPGAENTEWARTTLGDLYLNNGNPDSAAIVYRTSLVYRPSYPYALMGLAKVAKVKKDYNAAITYTRQAIEILSDQSFVSTLADLYELQGNDVKAKEIRKDIVELLEEGQEKEAKTPVKHNYTRELATAYMHAGNMDKALTYASKDLQMRPNNIDANELAAWIYYMKHDYANAKKHIDKALVTNIQNAETLYKAATIYGKAGLADKSNDLMQHAVSINPFIGLQFTNAAKYSSAITKR